jgi:hypothetical protein
MKLFNEFAHESVGRAILSSCFEAVLHTIGKDLITFGCRAYTREEPEQILE